MADTDTRKTPRQKDLSGCVIQIRAWAVIIGSFLGAAALFLTSHFIWGLICLVLSLIALSTMVIPFPGRWTTPILRLTSVLLVILIVVTITTSDEEAGQYIAAVRDGTPYDYPDITYGQAFEQYFQDGKWSYEGDNVIVFTGNYDDPSGEIETRIDFLIEDDTFFPTALYIDGESAPEDSLYLVIISIFESYDGGGMAESIPSIDIPDVFVPEQTNTAAMPTENTPLPTVSESGSTAALPAWCSGQYYGEDLYSTITFSPSGKPSFDIFIYRLVSISNCTGELDGNKLYFSGELDTGGTASGWLTNRGNGDIELYVSSSDFSYLEDGETIDFFYDYTDLSFYGESDDPLPLCGIYAMPDIPTNRLFVWTNGGIVFMTMMNRSETIAAASFGYEYLSSENDILYFSGYTNGTDFTPGEAFHGNYNPFTDAITFEGDFSADSEFSQYGYSGTFFRHEWDH